MHSLVGRRASPTTRHVVLSVSVFYSYSNKLMDMMGLSGRRQTPKSPDGDLPTGVMSTIK